MASRMPPALPKDLVAIVTILLVVVLVSFPASSAQVSVLVLVGGCVYFLLMSRTKQTAAELQMQRVPDMRSILLTRLEAKRAAQEYKTGKQREETSSQEDVSTAIVQRKADIAKNAPKAEGSGLVPQTTFKQAAAVGQPKAVEVAPSSKPVAKAKETATPEAGNRPSNAPLAGGAAVLARLRQQRAQGNKAAAAADKEAAAKEVVVAYASQTGTAQEIAKGIQAESAAHGIKSKIMSLNELGFEEVADGRAPLMVIVASSTGDGDPPDNSAKFYATMRRRTQEAGILKGVKFTCLGLGDSNYTRFMGVSRAIRTRMQELGAEPFYKMGEADEVDGLESNVDPWVEGLWAALQAEIGKKNEAAQSLAIQESSATVPKAGSQIADLVGVPALAACRVSLRWLGDATDSAGAREAEERHPTESEMVRRDPAGVYSLSAPYWATVTAARYLTATSSDRKVLHLEVDLSGSGMQYQPGDSLGVSPVNDSALVDGLLDRLGVDGGRVFEVVAAESAEKTGLLSHLGCPCTLRKALRCGVDLTSVPRKSLLRLLAEHCSDPEEQRTLLHLSSRGGRDEYAALISPASPSLLDLLRRFRSCQPRLDSLLDALQPLAPRLYSVSSSPLEHPESAHIAFSVVRIGRPPPNVAIPYPGMDAGSRDAACDSTNRWGVATGWLERQVEPLLAGKSKAAVKIPVHLRRGGTFGPPKDLSAPVLMIGPGTGVTPFRGFLQHRRQRLKQENRAAVGPAWLYFGCRRLDEDFLYKEELQEMVSERTLSRLEVAFSREGSEKKIYVQHRMREQADELYPILSHPDVFVFVCGDGANMAKDVHSTLAEILEKGGGTSAAEATARLAAMTKAGQYVRDIWS